MRQKLLAVLAGLGLALPVAAVETTAKTTLTITGMTCGGCVAAVKLQLKRTEGVTAYEVSLEKGEADVTYDPARTDPGTIAASVSKAGFRTTAKGEAREKRGDDRRLEDLDMGRLRDAFNRAAGSVRVVSLLSPTCPYCRSGHLVLTRLFRTVASEKVAGFLVWLPMLGSDDFTSALRQSEALRDPRIVYEAWDAGKRSGEAFARTLKLERTAWDVYLVYAPGVAWDGDLPPAPSFWMHQLAPDSGADQALCLNPARLIREVERLLERAG